jgi:hypothetical protein
MIHWTGIKQWHHQGGVLLFYKTSKHWHVEGTKKYGPNVIRTELVSGSKRSIIIGAYIPPSETDWTTLGWLQKATTVATTHPLILLRDLNVNFYQTPAGGFNERQEEKLALVASLGLTDLSRHFTQRIGWKDWTWSSKRPDGHRDRSVWLHSGPRTSTLPKLQDQTTMIREWS